MKKKTEVIQREWNKKEREEKQNRIKDIRNI